MSEIRTFVGQSTAIFRTLHFVYFTKEFIVSNLHSRKLWHNACSFDYQDDL